MQIVAELMHFHIRSVDIKKPYRSFCVCKTGTTGIENGDTISRIKEVLFYAAVLKSYSNLFFTLFQYLKVSFGLVSV